MRWRDWEWVFTLGFLTQLAGVVVLLLGPLTGLSILYRIGLAIIYTGITAMGVGSMCTLITKDREDCSTN
mgnify:CR=1 FL=1